MNGGSMRLKALVADDDPLMRRLCRGVLELAGCEVITANNGREAVELARQELPQVIILDLVMPETSGLEAFHQLKQSEPTKAIPIILISGSLDREGQEAIEASGAAGFLSKPFRPGALIEAIKPLLLQAAEQGTARA